MRLRLHLRVVPAGTAQLVHVGDVQGMTAPMGYRCPDCTVTFASKADLDSHACPRKPKPAK